MRTGLASAAGMVAKVQALAVVAPDGRQDRGALVSHRGSGRGISSSGAPVKFFPSWTALECAR